jgi:hypothetical protein
MTDTLGQFGRQFAEEVMIAAWDLADAIHRDAEPAAAGSDPSPELIRECLLFQTHVANRFGFARFGLVGRVAFFDALVDELDQFGLAAGFHSATNDAQRTFEQYRELVPGPGQATRGTLCWEFAKRLTRRYWPTKPALTPSTQLHAVRFVVALGERFFAEAPAA